MSNEKTTLPSSSFESSVPVVIASALMLVMFALPTFSVPSSILHPPIFPLRALISPFI